jgi:PAS domain S-box-containing protein
MSNIRSEKIMIVDDEIDVITPLSDFLTESGYEVMRFMSAKDALEALNKQDFDLLITDLMMPEIDGITLFRTALKKDRHLVCIIITGHGTVQTAVEAMKIGAFDYITKPLDWKILRPVVARAIEIRHLRKSEEKYRAIVEDQTELICRWMPDGTITYVNEVCCRYVGKSCEELIGHSSIPFMPAEELKKRIPVLTREQPVALMEHRAIMPNSDIRWQQWTNRAIFDEKGQIVEFQSVGRDITDLKNAEEALIRSRDQLSALTKRLSKAEETDRQRFSRELHDQIGQNLTALGINLNMLRNKLSGCLTGEIEALLTDMLSILEETMRRVRDLMADLRPSVLDDYGLLAVLRWYGAQFSRRMGLQINIQGEELVPRLPSEVETTLFRIVQEVLTNVVKHAGATQVTIRLDENNGKAHLTVTDNGVGFDPAAVNRLSERSGWGLLNIQERTKAIDGKLIIKSEPGKGTRLEIEIKR